MHLVGAKSLCPPHLLDDVREETRSFISALARGLLDLQCHDDFIPASLQLNIVLNLGDPEVLKRIQDREFTRFQSGMKLKIL